MHWDFLKAVLGKMGCGDFFYALITLAPEMSEYKEIVIKWSTDGV